MSTQAFSISATNTYAQYHYNQVTNTWKRVYTPEEVIEMRITKLFVRDYKRYSDRYVYDENQLISELIAEKLYEITSRE